MKQYKERMSAPAYNNKWYTSQNPYHVCGYGLPNCTCYVWGRIAELLGAKHKLSTNDGKDFWSHNDGYRRGKVPRVGAVACWKGGADCCGHVAIVERIEKNGAITVSESAYNGVRFRVRKIPKPFKLVGYDFQGFIYPCPEYYPSAEDIRRALLRADKSSQYDVNADGMVTTKDLFYRRKQNDGNY